MRRKQKQERDPRVTVKDLSLKDWGVIFLILVIINGMHMWVYQHLINIEGISVQLLINIMMGYVFAASLILCIITGFIRYKHYSKPVKRLSKAVRNIAAGDFSVRLTVPVRKDGRKDYIGVMFDDFNKMAEELASIESLKDDFIATVSHEIKTPLSIIQGYAMALQGEDLLPEERVEFTQTIVAASQRISLLVSNILKMNKLENQGIIPSRESYDLGEQIRRCVLEFEELWEKKNIRLTVDLDEVQVICSENILELVWNNLLSNAIKFTPPGGDIRILLRREEDQVAVSVADSGCGMDEQTQRRIFDKFYQGDSSRSQEGNGLGLALVKKALSLLGCTINVSSVPGEGSVFTVCLPADSRDGFKIEKNLQSPQYI
ncbi:HAMP domain-containing histidine kinase [Treponema sp. OttesenSCG-928-L16]|nr:HAMP domain-containing histidine kinase [Treponema sp. OttesenSCG-928-L16]